MLGQMNLPLTKKTFFTISGGPSFEAKNYPAYVFVKMAKEVNVPCDISIPTVDFSVPSVKDLEAGLLVAVDAILTGTPLYVGCMAGKGRTGLFMAVLAKAFGVEKPVEYVRENYYAHAVETRDQYKFVTEFEIPLLVKKVIKKRKFMQKLAFWRSGNLTNQVG